MSKARTYHYTGCGLSDVYLAGGFTVHKTPYGSGVSIVNLEGLHKAIGENIIEKTDILKDEEVRFLRKELGFSQKALGEILGVSDQAVAKWEKGTHKVSRSNDAILRALYQESVLKENVSIKQLVATIVEADRVQSEKRTFFVETDSAKTARWEMAVA